MCIFSAYHKFRLLCFGVDLFSWKVARTRDNKKAWLDARLQFDRFCEVTPFRLLVLLSFFSPGPAKASYEAMGTTCLCTHDYSSLLRVVQPLVELW